MDLHQCLGHISPSAAMWLVNNRNLDRIVVNDDEVDFCEVCALAKIKRLPFPQQRNHPAQDVGDVLHTDVWGPAQTTALGGSSYAITFIDEYTRHGVVEGMRAKSSAFDEYRYHEAWLRVQFGKEVKHLQLD